MKLRSITSRKGWSIPALATMRSGLPVEVEAILSRGWRIHRRAQTLLFVSPPDEKTGECDLYERHVDDFDLNWRLGPTDDIASVTKWDSHPPVAAQQQGGKK